MKKSGSLFVLSACLGVAAWVWAHEGHEQDMKAVSQAGSHEFQQIKLLAGKWSGMMTHTGKPSEPVATHFKLIAGGTTVQETISPGTPHEMVDMYVDENSQLAMTHYCLFGNQPHLVLRQASERMIALEMGPTPGIAPNAPHMHALTLEFPDANHLTERWTSYKDGKPSDSSVMTLVRVK